MAIMVIIDGNTVKETTENTLALLNAIDPKHCVSADDITKVMNTAPKSIDCVGYKYTRHDDGTIEVVVKDAGIRKMNAFVSAWAPALAGVVLGLKSQIKVVTKFLKRMVKANNELVRHMYDKLIIDGLSPEAWADKKAKELDGITEDMGPLV